MARPLRFLAPWSRSLGDAGVRPGSAASRPARRFASPEALEEHLASLKGMPAIYHCTSRIVDKRRILGEEEKARFIRYMREYELYCQVRVLTFCVMDNHFHILVEVPEAPEDRGRSWTDGEFLEHIAHRYHDAEYWMILNKLASLREQGDDKEAERLRESHFNRMWDLSWFLRLLKQRFTQWYNWKHGRDGYLWSDRFKSVIVESGMATRIVAAYIDLNPVRAGIVEDPGDYAWSGWGEASAGRERAREGLKFVVFEWLRITRNEKLAAREASRWKSAASYYHWTMFMGGEESERDRRKGRAGIPSEKVAEVLREEGLEEEAEFLRRGSSMISRAKVLGTPGFVDAVAAVRLGRAPEAFVPRDKDGREDTEKTRNRLNALFVSARQLVSGG